MKRETKFLAVTLIFSALHFSLFSQDKYYPQGNPKKFQAEITAPLWLPWISGQVGVDGLLKDVQGNINATPADLLNNLKAALMLDGDVSKGGFIGFVNYMHLTLETDKKQSQIIQGGTATWNAKVKQNVLDIAAGGRIHFNKGMIDPFFGVRYFDLNSSLNLSANDSTKTGSKKIDYWDPFVGARLFYYPKERIMLFLRTDFGGMWGGSPKFSWNIEGKAGYSISPTIDIAGGFRSWGFKYSEYTSRTRIFYMNPHLYGFEVSASFLIPKRSSDARVFPKKK